MSVSVKAWDSEQVRKWLECRVDAASRDQAAADKRGYDARDDYDKAAAEEWACRSVRSAADTGDRAVFADCIKQLLGQDDYRITGVYDDRRVERYIRANLRKFAKMAKLNEGFENMLRYQ